jgi:hypothetical protein
MPDDADRIAESLAASFARLASDARRIESESDADDSNADEFAMGAQDDAVTINGQTQHDNREIIPLSDGPALAFNIPTNYRVVEQTDAKIANKVLVAVCWGSQWFLGKTHSTSGTKATKGYWKVMYKRELNDVVEQYSGLPNHVSGKVQHDSVLLDEDGSFNQLPCHELTYASAATRNRPVSASLGPKQLRYRRR